MFILSDKRDDDDDVDVDDDDTGDDDVVNDDHGKYDDDCFFLFVHCSAHPITVVSSRPARMTSQLKPGTSPQDQHLWRALNIIPNS